MSVDPNYTALSDNGVYIPVYPPNGNSNGNKPKEGGFFMGVPQVINHFNRSFHPKPAIFRGSPIETPPYFQVTAEALVAVKQPPRRRPEAPGSRKTSPGHRPER